jgi:hypothetical protein
VKDKQLLNILFRIKNNSYSDNDLNSMANYCINLSVHYLNKKHLSFFSSRNNSLEKVEDIAVDSITPLFVTSGSEDSIGLQKSLFQWNKPIEDESDAELFINRIVWNRTEQTIVSLYKQNDPFFAKIYKTITTCISENDFKKISYFGINYIAGETDVKLSGDLISQNEFDKLPDSLFFKKQSTLLNGLLDYFQLQLGLFPAIPFNLLIKRIKHLSLRDYNESSIDERNNLELILSLKPAMNICLEEVRIRLDNYRTQKKLSDTEYKCFLNVFNNISDDLMNGGGLISLYEYLLIEMPELTRKLFYKKYHRPLSYVFELFRSHVSEQLEI